MPATQISFTAFALAAFADNTRSIAVPGGVDTQQVVSVVLCAPPVTQAASVLVAQPVAADGGECIRPVRRSWLVLVTFDSGLSAGTSVLTRSVACVILALLVSSFFAATAVSLGMAGVTCLLLSLTVWRCDHASPFRFHVWHVLRALCARYAGPPLIAQSRFIDSVTYRVLDHQICDPDAQDQRYQCYR